MRRVLGLMGDGEDGAQRRARPGMATLDTLAHRTTAAGLPVKLRREGQARTIPAGVDLAAYRVAQEALTNAMKHANASRAELVVRYAREQIELEIGDDGTGPPATTDGDGHGLDGMRERVTLYGGELWTGRARGGGFRVLARLPLEGSA
jgi:signal transduction histidine kinase